MGERQTMTSMESSESDLLAIVLDLDPTAWSAGSDDMDDDAGALGRTLEHVFVFCNAHLALRHENHLTVIGATAHAAKLLYSTAMSTSQGEDEDSGVLAVRDGATYMPFRLAGATITARASSMIEEASERTDSGGHVQIVRALACALCHINRVHAAADAPSSAASAPVAAAAAVRPRARVLIISASGDVSAHYVPTMNLIFAAQKNNIPIDVCKLRGNSDSVFLQQACHLTSGAYLRPPPEVVQGSLLQYLISTYLPGVEARRTLTVPSDDRVDLRAACFCHRKIVELAYVCSVCLSSTSESCGYIRIRPRSCSSYARSLLQSLASLHDVPHQVSHVDLATIRNFDPSCSERSGEEQASSAAVGC